MVHGAAGKGSENGRKGLSISFLYAAIVFLLVLFAYLAIFRQRRVTTDINTIGRAFELACERGSYGINISLGGKKKMVMQKNINLIRVQGDPSHVLYYEFFPPVDDVPWLYWIRDEMPAIVYAFLNETTAKDVDGYEALLRGKARDVVGERDVRVVFINLAGSGEKAAAISREDSIFSKYSFCGENALCLREGKRTYAYELKACRKKGVEHVVIYHPYFARLASAILLKSHMSSDVAEGIARIMGITDWTNMPYPFYLASPCYNEELELEVGECECRRLDMPVFDAGGKAVSQLHWCDTFSFFTDKSPERVKCLRVGIRPSYSRSFCYNNDLSNQFRYPGGVLGAIYGGVVRIDMNSLRHCITRLDENAILFDTSCMDDLAVSMGLRDDVIRGLERRLTLLTGPEQSEFMSAWPVDVFLVG